MIGPGFAAAAFAWYAVAILAVVGVIVAVAGLVGFVAGRLL